MADDRPIIVSGAEQMVTVELPELTKPKGGLHSLKPLPADGPFTTIVFTNSGTGVEFRTPATGNWTITIE
jgi:hypothetical protein